jgi:mannose-6-phosphate isomerase-like protein (cupin superfamily)
MNSAKKIFLFFTLLYSLSSISQKRIEVLETLDDLGFWSKNVISVSSDSNCSTFLISVTDKIKSHYHSWHTENLYVISGSAEMKLADSTLTIKTGDLIVIPPNTIHSIKVKTMEKFQLISIQSPEFKGKDRVLVKEE